jgi:hypothetical protein
VGYLGVLSIDMLVEVHTSIIVVGSKPPLRNFLIYLNTINLPIIVYYTSSHNISSILDKFFLSCELSFAFQTVLQTILGCLQENDFNHVGLDDV